MINKAISPNEIEGSIFLASRKLRSVLELNY
jgi:hypothetical protein